MPTPSPIGRDPGSLRDPSGTVVTHNGKLFRCFTAAGAKDFQAAAASGLLESLARRGLVAGWSALSPEASAPLTQAIPGTALVVEHAPVAFISYCYEWPFEMLQRAALATLKIAAESLESGFILKDATPYNIQFEGPRAVFIDFGSFAPYVEGQPWAAYSQFCRMFLNPLIVQAYGGIPFRPWLRGEMDGITPAQANRALGLRHKLRWAPLVHVTLQSWLDKSKLAEGLTEAPRPVSKRTLARLLGSLRGFVSKLKPRPEHSPWAVYGDDPGYQQEAQAAKCAFIERTLDRVKPSMVWDLGCNTGTYALLAARRSKAVVAMDRDEAAVSVLYRLAAQDAPNVLPLVMDLCNPSPNRGWAQAERKGLAERGPADVVLCLALLHHLVLDAGIPLPAVLEWLAGIGRSAIIEYPSPEDPRVRQLLARKAGIRQWPAEQEFRVLLSERLDVLETTALPKSARTLLLVKPGISRDNS